MSTTPSVHLIVFSKDRPLQLHGYLTSLFARWHGPLAVSVLVKGSPAYDPAYRQVIDEFSNRVFFEGETDFSEDLGFLVDKEDTPLTCFGTDDAVFMHDVVGASLVDVFTERDDILGVSFRLGKPVIRGMFGQDMQHPTFLSDGRGWQFESPPQAANLLWDCTALDSVGDWAYPWEVVGTVYQTPFVRRMVEAIAAAGKADSPSHLEHHGSLIWQQHAEGKTLLRAWTVPRLVLPTVNVVQQVFGNGTVGDAALTPEFLLECWNRGLRLDTFRYAAGPEPRSWRVGDFYLRRAT